MNAPKIILLSLLFSPIIANIGPQGFHQFNENKFFVETGTYGGRGLELAMQAGFKNLYSIEINNHFYTEAIRKFRNNPNVHLYLGDSGKMLFDVIKHINEEITFWLDGHNGFPTPTSAPNTPLLQELEQIKLHPIKTHTILIDDMHCCETELFDYITKEQIMAKILEINPDYTIYFVPGGDEGEYPQNVMVAQVLNK